MSEEVYYRKVGRRYVPDHVRWERDKLAVGQFRLHYAYSNGSGMYRYDVKPDTAGFLAAASIAENAVEEVIMEAIAARPFGNEVPHTKKQQAIIERYRKEMAEAGGLLPDWWGHTSARELSRVMTAAVRNYKP